MKAKHEFNSEEEYQKYLKTYFAALAMQGMLAESGSDFIGASDVLKKIGLPEDTTYEYPKHYMQYISMCSVAAADALILSLNKQIQ